MARLRRLADLTQEGLAERSGVSVDVIRKLEQHRKHSARLPTLHSLAKGLGVELTGLLGDPPGVPSSGDAEPPQLVAVRRAIMPPLFAPPVEPTGVERLSLPLLRAELAEGWTLYHAAEFGRLMDVLPGIIADARLLAAVGNPEQRAAGQAALGKALSSPDTWRSGSGRLTWHCPHWSAPTLLPETRQTPCWHRWSPTPWRGPTNARPGWTTPGAWPYTRRTGWSANTRARRRVSVCGAAC